MKSVFFPKNVDFITYKANCTDFSSELIRIGFLFQTNTTYRISNEYPPPMSLPQLNLDFTSSDSLFSNLDLVDIDLGVDFTDEKVDMSELL